MRASRHQTGALIGAKTAVALKILEPLSEKNEDDFSEEGGDGARD